MNEAPSGFDVGLFTAMLMMKGTACVMSKPPDVIATDAAPSLTGAEPSVSIVLQTCAASEPLELNRPMNFHILAAP